MQQTWTAWCGLLWLRLVTNLLVLAILGGCGYLVWFLGAQNSLEVTHPVADLSPKHTHLHLICCPSEWCTVYVNLRSNILHKIYI